LQEGSDQLLAPDLIRLEVAAAITRRVRSKDKPLTPADAEQRCGEWFRFLENATLELIPQDQLLAEAVTLSINGRHALQDCLYLAAARRNQFRLITADKVFHDRVLDFYPKIAMLPGCQAN
jgi:predicted nucleic acid-binding protein